MGGREASKMSPSQLPYQAQHVETTDYIKPSYPLKYSHGLENT